MCSASCNTCVAYNDNVKFVRQSHSLPSQVFFCDAGGDVAHPDPPNGLDRLGQFNCHNHSFTLLLPRLVVMGAGHILLIALTDKIHQLLR